MLHTQTISLKNQRTHMVSDIHGNLKLFKKLLTNLQYSASDTLILNGDVCEKGQDSLGLIRYIMDLHHTHRVYTTLGNNDAILLHLLKENVQLIPYLERQPYSLIHEMLREQNREWKQFSSIKEIAQFCLDHYQAELEWIQQLPHALESEDFIIIHAGIERTNDWRETSLTNAYAFPSFYEHGHDEEKTVIVGHWPISNYLSREKSHMNPIIDFDRRIICLDGGLQVKSIGQLNALTLQDGLFEATYVDECKQIKEIVHSFSDESKQGTINWPNYLVEKQEKQEHFTLCYSAANKTNYWIKNEYLTYQDEQWQCTTDVSASFLTVKQGDQVSILDDQCSGYDLAKKDGYYGWIPKSCT